MFLKTVFLFQNLNQLRPISRQRAFSSSLPGMPGHSQLKFRRPRAVWPDLPNSPCYSTVQENQLPYEACSLTPCFFLGVLFIQRLEPAHKNHRSSWTSLQWMLIDNWLLLNLPVPRSSGLVGIGDAPGCIFTCVTLNLWKCGRVYLSISVSDLANHLQVQLCSLLFSWTAVQQVSAVPTQARRRRWILWNWSYCHETWCLCWESNLGVLKAHPVFLTAKPVKNPAR